MKAWRVLRVLAIEIMYCSNCSMYKGGTEGTRE